MKPVPVWDGSPVDNDALVAFRDGARKLGLELHPGVLPALEIWVNELLKWNARVNLTAIAQPLEVVEKHLLDSLAVVPEVAGATTLLDLGAGAGLPGIPLAIALPGLSVTMVDAVNKKVAFLKHVVVKLGLVSRVRAVHVRAEGSPAEEGLVVAEVVIARALMDVDQWVPFALPYLARGGRLIAMLARPPAREKLSALARTHGLVLSEFRNFVLPASGDPRSVAVFRSER
jgi:16S rRNA (guanine527-N7)-methyltransferase